MQNITYTVSIDNSIPLNECMVHLVLSSNGPVFNNLRVEILNGVLASNNIIETLDETVSTELLVYRLQSTVIYVMVSMKNSSPLFIENGVNNISLNLRDTNSVTNLQIPSYIKMKQQYNPIMNFYNGSGSYIDDLNYTSPFRVRTEITRDSNIDLRLQTSYDGSVNMIFAPEDDTVRLVNTRFIVNKNSTKATLADRYAKKDTNTYSEKYFYRTKLIPAYSNIPKLEFEGVFNGGILKAGGYKYYFRYITADGAETDIIEESRLVSIHEGNDPTSSIGVLDNGNTSKSVRFSISNLDTTFKGITVYYTKISGEAGVIPTSFRLLEPYNIDKGIATITHTGYEQEASVSNELIGIPYSKFGEVSSIEITDDRLLLANSNLASTFSLDQAELATRVTLSEDIYELNQSIRMNGTENNNFSNPKISYEKVGYWPGETEEIGVVFITDRGLSPVYPIQGLDNLDGTAEYDFNKLGVTDTIFSKSNGQNSLGVYRTSNTTKSFWRPNSIDATKLDIDNISLTANILHILGFPNTVTAYKVLGREENDIAVLENITSTGDKTYDLYGNLVNSFISGTTLSIDNISVDIEETITTTYIDPLNGKTITSIWDISKGDLTLTSNIDSDGTAVNGIPKGILITAKKITKEPNTEINGYFFVRRKRINDRILQGVSVPVAAVPSMTNTIAERAIASPGNYLGIGTDTVVGSGASTKVPAPLCMMPFGFENFETDKVLTEVDSTDTTNQNTHTDFILRSPVLDKTDIKSLAFYSPDIDTSTVAMATRLSDTNVNVIINTSTLTFVPNLLDTQPLKNGAMIDSVRLATPIESVTELSINAIVNYVTDGVIRTGKTGFSSSMDRNLYLYTNYEISNTSADINFTYYNSEGTETENPFWIDSEFKPVASGVPAEHVDTSIVQTDSNMAEARTPGVGINYGRYIGITLDSYDTGLDPLYLTESGTPNTIVKSTLRSSIIDQQFTFEASDTLGFITNIYPAGQDGPISRNSWISRYKYDGNTEYVAITRRYSIDELQPIFMPLYGGDCYTGIQWKQIWSPKGIPGLPNATDVSAFLLTREGLSLLDYGFALPIPARANNNFFIRTPERADELEWKVWGSDRSYLPIHKDIRGNKQKDTSLYNLGYSANYYTANKYFKINNNFPFILDKYPNRIYASDPASTDDFKNGLTSFKGLNFKDYNFELGPIRRLTKLLDYVTVVFDSGVGVIQVKESTMVSKDGVGVFVDNIKVLPDKLHIISSLYGTQDKDSVVPTEGRVYGVDVYNNLIWTVSPNKYAGLQLQELSTKKIQTLLAKTISEMDAVYDAWVDDIYTVDIWKKVRASYDKEKHDIYFTFTVYAIIGAEKFTKYSKSIVYNELVQLWTTRTDNDVAFVFPIKKDRLLMTASSFGRILKFNAKDYHTKDKEYNIFDGKYYNAEIEFVVKGKSPLGKTFDNLIIHGVNSVPDSIIYNTDKLLEDKTQTIYKATNVTYESENTVVSGIDGTAEIEIDPINLIKWNGEPLTSGDYIQFEVNGNDVQMVVKLIDSTTNMLSLDKLLEANITEKEPLRFGYYTNEMITNTIIEQQATKITCRFDSSENGEFRPEGSKVKIHMIFSGSSFITLSSIFTYSDTVSS